MRRNTIQRSIILETVNKLKCHATADEVYNEVARENPHISRSTVYRNLNFCLLYTSGRKSCQGAGWCERVRRERTVYGGYRHIRQR